MYFISYLFVFLFLFFVSFIELDVRKGTMCPQRCPQTGAADAGAVVVTSSMVLAALLQPSQSDLQKEKISSNIGIQS